MSPRRRNRAGSGAERGAAASSKLWLMAYGPSGLERDGPIVHQRLEGFECGGVVAWIHVTGLGSREVIDAVAERFGVHPVAVEDIVAAHERPKSEVYGDKLFVVLRFPERTPSGFEVHQLSFVFGKGFIVSFSEVDVPRIEQLRHRIRGDHGRVRHAGPDFVAHALIDGAVDQAVAVVDAVEDDLQDLEDDILEGRTAHVVPDLLKLRRQLLRIRRALVPLGDAVRELMSEARGLLGEDILPHLRDVLDHIAQTVDRVEQFRDFEQGLIQLVVSSDSARMNETMKVLTIISTIFIPLSFIASVYGMNFDPDASPWNMPELRSTWGYPAVLGVMALVGAILLGWFWRKGWLSRGLVQQPPPGFEGATPESVRGDPNESKAP
ncbi:MAG: magnesium/cobalt transporter CorA [Myxococcales bacterium]|nr:magnesium/cobalt transporter CorA [Myxococcales bacterium]